MNRKKKRSDQRKMKRKANRKLKRIYLREKEKEIKCIRLKLQSLKDTYEKEKKIYEDRIIMFKEQCLKVEFPKLEKKSKEISPSGDSFLGRDNVEVELQCPRVVKDEYVEYETFVKIETDKGRSQKKNKKSMEFSITIFFFWL